MIILVDVTKLHLAVACLGNTSLNGHHSLHLLLSSSLVVAYHLEELLYVCLVSLTDLLGLVVVIEIIVAHSQSKTTLSHFHQIIGSITKVGTHTDAIHHGTLATEVKLSSNQLILSAVLDGSDAVESRLDRCPALLVQSNAVHAEVVE